MNDNSDISSQRLSKVRAGSHLTAVLKNSTQAENPDSQRGDQMSNFETERDMPPVDQNYISNRKHNEKQLPLSKFMERYQNQKGVDANVLSTKEHNIYHFFKEKFDLMGKYLGEDVLKEGLLTGGPIDNAQGGTQAEKKKAKKLDMDGREQYLLGLMANNVAGFDPRESQNAKVVRINREIMSQILREEHKKEMDELLKLQTEQNMQVFNDLQDIDAKETNQKTALTSRNRTPPSKMILKNNFLRTFVNIDTAADRPFTSNNQNGYTADSWRKSQSIRPVTEQLVFRTKQKREQLIPNVEEISVNLNLHKFGSIPRGIGETPLYRHENNNSPTSLGERDVHDLRIKTGVLESPRITTANQNSRPMTKGSSVRNYFQSIGARSESVKSLIHEEIEFLKNERNPVREQGVKIPPSQQGFPQRKIQIFYDTQSEIKKPTIGVNFPHTTSNIKSSSKGFSFNPLPPKKSAVVENRADKNKPLVHINPKVDISAVRSLTRNSLTQKHSTKIMSQTTNSPSRWNPEIKETKRAHNKQSHYVTKLVSVGSKQENARSGLLPMMSHDLDFNQQAPVKALLKNSFGNKYWRNNFN